jgi:hypothetical protein
MDDLIHHAVGWTTSRPPGFDTPRAMIIPPRPRMDGALVMTCPRQVTKDEGKGSRQRMHSHHITYLSGARLGGLSLVRMTGFDDDLTTPDRHQDPMGPVCRRPGLLESGRHEPYEIRFGLAASLVLRRGPRGSSRKLMDEYS